MSVCSLLFARDCLTACLSKQLSEQTTARATARATFDMPGVLKVPCAGAPVTGCKESVPTLATFCRSCRNNDSRVEVAFHEAFTAQATLSRMKNRYCSNEPTAHSRIVAVVARQARVDHVVPLDFRATIAVSARRGTPVLRTWVRWQTYGVVPHAHTHTLLRRRSPSLPRSSSHRRHPSLVQPLNVRACVRACLLACLLACAPSSRTDERTNGRTTTGRLPTFQV